MRSLPARNVKFPEIFKPWGKKSFFLKKIKFSEKFKIKIKNKCRGVVLQMESNVVTLGR